VIDAGGFRLNVGIILINQQRQLFWAKRIGQRDAWQFPQGGIHENESPEDALYRELAEEIGLTKDDVEIVTATNDWLSYKLPKRFIRYSSKPLCIGQKQKWFLLRLVSNDQKISLDKCQTPEFDSFKWVHHRYPLKEVVVFKRQVYKLALREFMPFIKP